MIEKTGVDASQETEPIILDVYNKKLKRDYKVPTLTDPCHGAIRLIEPIISMLQLPHGTNKGGEVAKDGKTPSMTTSSWQHNNFLVSRIITHHMPEIVKVRKYEVNIPALQDCLKKHKKPIKELQKALQIPKTTIEHWFRNDSSFSIPDTEIWFNLKNILGIETDEFDKSITEFEEREGVFDKSNRVYDENGLSPTLTSASASEEKILVRNVVAMRGRGEKGEMEQKLEERKDGKTNSLTTVQKDNLIKEPIKLDISINESQSGAVYSVDGKSVNLCANGGGQGAKTGLYAIGLTEVRTEEAKKIRKETGTNPKRAKELVERTDDKTGALLTSPTNDNLIKEVIAGDYRTDEGVRWRENGKSPTLMARAREDLSGPPLVNNTFRIRRLTPKECERLQTVEDGYTNHVSDSQRYKMLGNGWTVDVIAHIFSHLK